MVCDMMLAAGGDALAGHSMFLTYYCFVICLLFNCDGDGLKRSGSAEERECCGILRRGENVVNGYE